jgi:hypothetical protein
MATQATGFGAGGFGYGGYGGTGFFQPLQAESRQYYQGLITSEWQGSTKFIEWFNAVLSPIFDLIQFLTGLDDNFDLDMASGVQLDILGTIVGARRVVPFVPSNGVSPILDDPTFLLLIKATIVRNQFNGLNNGTLQTIWQTLFPGGTIVIDDQQNMTANVFLTGQFTSIITDLINHNMIVPRPQGVQYNFFTPTLPVFATDQNTAFAAGVDLGHIL